MFGRKGLVCLAVTVAMSGCYTYSPVRPADAVLNARVRATVSSAQAEELAQVLRSATSQVVGTLVERNDERVLLEVPLWAGGTGVSSQALHSRVSIPFSDLVSLESRTFSRWRTAVSVGAVVAAVAGSWTFIGGGTELGDKEKTGIDNAIIPFFSVPFAIFR